MADIETYKRTMEAHRRHMDSDDRKIFALEQIADQLFGIHAQLVTINHSITAARKR